MVSVAHGVQEAVRPLPERRKRVRNRRERVSLHAPHAQAAAVFHQLEIAQRRSFAQARVQRLDHGAGGVVQKQHHVRAFQRRALADAQARGNPLANRALRGADHRAGAGREVVFLQIDGGHQPQPRAGRGGALGEREAVSDGAHERSVRKVFAHRPVNGGNARAGALQIDFRLHDVKRGRTRAHVCLHPPPVIRLRGVLVAGDDRPPAQVNPFRGKINVVRLQTRKLHGLSLLCVCDCPLPCALL